MQGANGFIKLFRNITEWRWYHDANVLRVFLHLLINASFKDCEWRQEKISKGQVIIGRKTLASDLGISESMVTRVLKKLESTGEISIKTTNKYSVITISNWDKYQIEDYVFDQQTTNKRPTNDQQSNNNRTTTEHILIM